MPLFFLGMLQQPYSFRILQELEHMVEPLGGRQAALPEELLGEQPEEPLGEQPAELLAGLLVEPRAEPLEEQLVLQSLKQTNKQKLSHTKSLPLL
jgi:hypothetical protein